METIVSLATAPMKSALAIIRISGDKTYEIVSKIFSKELPYEGGRIIYGNILDLQDKIIDEVTLSCFKAPKSFTGEDVIEINCHGSLIIINKIIELIVSLGARLAERGEFTSRAFYNGKIDLVQAEAINSLINSKTEEQRKLAMMSLKGKTSKKLEPVKTLLADILANIEVNIDYPEYEDIEQVSRDKILQSVDFLVKNIDELLNRSNHASLFIEGVKVAIVGRPNVGKSSLLNVLLGQNKAIVTDIPGTTRDIVEGEIHINGLILHLIDTAGVRDSHDRIESMGIDKTREQILNADLIIYVKDNENDEYEELEKIIKGKKTLEVINKKDLLKEFNTNKIYISAKNNDVDNLIKRISNIFDLDTNIEPSLCSAREIGLLKATKEELYKAYKEAMDNYPLDLVSIHLKDAYDSIKRILGEEITPDLEQEVFSRFCVGK